MTFVCGLIHATDKGSIRCDQTTCVRTHVRPADMRKAMRWNPDFGLNLVTGSAPAAQNTQPASGRSLNEKLKPADTAQIIMDF
jgi:hypothetical protein